jgi:2-dehydro-3-deoxyphosphooctonate aldolase (KDO 8-P synthase)
VSEVADIIQIPAFLCRQTDLLEAACRTGRAVNVKKGQFLSPESVGALVRKLRAFNASEYWITERGSCFGYGRLVVDFSAFVELERLGAPLVMDLTHSVQIMGGGGNVSAGVREAVPTLARASAAAGVLGFFAEVHPNPDRALSDGANAWPLDGLYDLICRTQKIAKSAHEVA